VSGPQGSEPPGPYGALRRGRPSRRTGRRRGLENHRGSLPGGLVTGADSSGHSTGNHLYITVRDQRWPNGGHYVEPLAYADTQPTDAERHGGC